MNSNKPVLAWLMVSSLLSGCSLAPDFKQPELPLTTEYKESAEIIKGEWKPAMSREQNDRGKWWEIFADPSLNALEEQAASGNQDMKAALARVEASRSLVRANAVTLFPNIDIGANIVRSKPADATTAAFGGPATHLKPYTLYSAGATASYEADLFARAHDTERALNFDADAQEALYKSALLSLQADVAAHYFQLRALDAERILLTETIGVRTEAERIMQKRVNAGSAGEVDLTRTQSDLASAKADLIALERRRATLENALALLLGKNPSDYHLPAMAEPLPVPPMIPAGIPSELLLRRPDIASAQAAMASANRRIGVARTAFFPSLFLTASGGFESVSLADVFKWSSRSWALGQQAGSALTMPLFNSGRTAARVDIAHAAYDEAVANYRQQVLVALGDVENALSDQRLLAEQSLEVNKADNAARRSNDLLQKQYDEGNITYFEVVDAQRNALASGRNAIQTRGARLIATINLIRALGGEWNPPSNQVTID